MTVKVPNFYAVILTAVTTRELRSDVIQKLLQAKFAMEAMIVIACRRGRLYCLPRIIWDGSSELKIFSTFSRDFDGINSITFSKSHLFMKNVSQILTTIDFSRGEIFGNALAVTKNFRCKKININS